MKIIVSIYKATVFLTMTLLALVGDFSLSFHEVICEIHKEIDKHYGSLK